MKDIAIITGTILALIEEKKFQSLRDVLRTMQPVDVAMAAAELTPQDLSLVFRLLPKDEAADTFAEGDVGAGAGMVCYSLKGGIGSASRLCRLYGETYTVGALVMTNFGTLRDLKVAGDSVGERLFWQEQSELKDKGSIIVIIATDVPLSARQLERVAKRSQSGIARTGGSGLHHRKQAGPLQQRSAGIHPPGVRGGY